MDSLEKFIHQHRADFDDAKVPEGIWQRIEVDLDRQKPGNGTAWIRSLWRPLSLVAAMLLLLFTGALAGIYVYKSQISPQPMAQASLAHYAPEYAELERYFQQQVDVNLQRLTAYDGTEAVTSDLSQLDEVFQELARELEAAPRGTEERIIQAMIDNYRTRLEILEHVLNKVEGVPSVKPTQPSKTTSNEIML